MGQHNRVVFLLLSTIVLCSYALDDHQKMATRAAFQQLLRLQPPPLEGLKQHHLKPPRHMLELYQKYQHNGGLKKTTGNTVRSILPTIKGSEMVLFNVTCIGRAEEVHLAQLHLHRRRLRRTGSTSHRRRVLAPPCKVKLYRVVSNPRKHRSRTVPLASLPVPESIRGGWHSLDITPVLRELLLGGGSSSTLQLGVRFEGPRSRPISPEEFLSIGNETSAFVVVFSEDLLDNSVEPHEVRQALHRIKNDDLYLEHDDTSIETDPIELNENDDFNDFSFDKDEELKPVNRGSHKKKTNRKNVAKSVLDSLSEDVKEKVDDKEYGGQDNDLEDAYENEESQFSSSGMKKPLQAENEWPSKESSHKSTKDFQNNGIFRRRRMHPKSRYRVKMWKESDVLVSHKDKQKGKDVARLIKYSDDASQENAKRPDDNAVDDNDEGRVKRTPREKRHTEPRLQDLSFDDATMDAGDQREDPNNPQRAKSSHVTNSRDLEADKPTENDLGEQSVFQRARRSIHDNELPDSQVRNREGLLTSPEKLLDNRVTQQPYRETAKLIPYPTPANRRWRGEGNRRRGRGKKRDSKKKGKKTQKGVEQWHHSPEQAERQNTRTSSYESRICHRKKLQVDFADIGWANWIISPSQFEAYYCAGRCSYPLTKVVKPTNHATMQSLISALGHQPEVPEPCCVPDRLSSTSLLYFDDNQNVVLKNYQDMSVESCACR